MNTYTHSERDFQTCEWRAKLAEPKGGRGQSGFTLLEVLIALTLLAVGVLAVIQMFPTAFQYARVAAERTASTHMAETEFNQLRTAGAEYLAGEHPTGLVEETYTPNGQFIGMTTTATAFRDAHGAYLHRVTYVLEKHNGQYETFVTYVAKQ